MKSAVTQENVCRFNGLITAHEDVEMQIGIRHRRKVGSLYKRT